MKITLLDAMEALGVGGYIKNNDFNSIVWANPSETVSREVLEAKLSELQADYDALKYQRDRASQYPSIQDVVVALAEKQEGDDTMWQEITAQRAKVKSDNPKPE